MEDTEISIIEKISAMADQLPEEKRKQLLDLVADWREDIRHAARQPYNELLTISSGTGSGYGHARDVSTTGVFIENSGDFNVGDKVKLMLTFISAPNPLRLSGTVVRKSGDGIGVNFDEISQSQIRELDSIIANHALILRSK